MQKMKVVAQFYDPLPPFPVWRGSPPPFQLNPLNVSGVVAIINFEFNQRNRLGAVS